MLFYLLVVKDREVILRSVFFLISKVKRTTIEQQRDDDTLIK